MHRLLNGRSFAGEAFAGGQDGCITEEISGDDTVMKFYHG